jgi:hypothetical protein
MNDGLKVVADDSLNFHDQILTIMRKDGHYDYLYNKSYNGFDLNEVNIEMGLEL